MEEAIEPKPHLYYECKPEDVILAPEHAPVITPQDNKQLIDDLREFTQKQNDVIKQLIEKQENLEDIIKKQNDLLLQITDRLKK